MRKYFWWALDATGINQVARPWMLHNAAEHGARPSPCLHQQALQKPRVCSQKNSDINQLMFFLLEKPPHNYLQEMKRSYDDIICTWFFFFCPFFSTKIFKQRALMWNYHCITWSSKRTFLPRMQSWPPRRMYKYDQICLRKCRLRGSKNSKLYPSLEWLVLLVQFSGWYLHHNDPQKTSREGPVFFLYL